MRPAVTFVNYVYSKKNKQQFRHLGIPLTATFIRAAREPAHNKGYGPFPEKVGRPRSKLKGSTTAHVRGGVTPFTSLRNHLIINRYISYFYFDFHLQTTLRHRGLWEGGGDPRDIFLPYEILRIDGMTLKTYQTKIKFRAQRAWRGILREQFNTTSISVPGNIRSITTPRTQRSHV